MSVFNTEKHIAFLILLFHDPQRGCPLKKGRAAWL